MDLRNDQLLIVVVLNRMSSATCMCHCWSFQVKWYNWSFAFNTMNWVKKSAGDLFSQLLSFYAFCREKMAENRLAPRFQAGQMVTSSD